MPTPNRLVFGIYRTPNGRLQAQLAQLDADDNGHGYRLAGPKFLGDSSALIEEPLTERDAQEIRAMLDAVFPPADAAVPADLPRLFHLQRDHDISGVSGTGRVANGVLWPDGTATLRWIGDRPSTVHWDRLDDAVAIHGHGGATRIVWADEQPPADRAALREHIAETLYRENPVPEIPWEQAPTPVRERFRRSAAAVLAVLAAPTDRAAVLAEAYEIAYAEGMRLNALEAEIGVGPYRGALAVAHLLRKAISDAQQVRRLADEVKP